MAGAACSSQDGERLEDEIEAECGFYELGSEYGDPSHCETPLKPTLHGAGCGQSNLWILEISLLQTESGELSAKSRDTWTGKDQSPAFIGTCLHALLTRDRWTYKL